MKSQIEDQGNKFPRINASTSVWLGNVAQKQSGGVDGRDDCADKSCSDGHSGVVRSDAVQCVEEPISHNPLEHQNRGSSPGSSGMVSNSQPVMEVHHR